MSKRESATERAARISGKYRLLAAIIAGIFVIIGTSIALLTSTPTAQDATTTPTSLISKSSSAMISPSRSPEPSDTPVPTFTPTVTRSSTPTPLSFLVATGTPGCYISDAKTIFAEIQERYPTLTNNLGRFNLPEPVCTWAAHQPFERGQMLWRADAGLIYVLLQEDSTWKSYPDTWTIQNPSYSCNLEVPEGLYHPHSGFGKLWCEDDAVRESVGFGLVGEIARSMTLQTFEGGILILRNGSVYVMIYGANKQYGTFKEVVVIGN